MKKGLNHKQKKFCHEYIVDWNKTRAYKAAYKAKTDNAAAACAVKLLRNVKVEEYIEKIRYNYEQNTGVTKTRQLLELAKIAYSSIAHLHENWITLKEYELLTLDQLAAIESTETETQQKLIDKEYYEVVKIKIKLYPKIQALAEINKMMGFNSPDKVDLTTLGKSINNKPDLKKLNEEELRQYATIQSKLEGD